MIIEGRIGVSFAAYDIPPSCVFDSVKKKINMASGKLRLGVSLCKCIFYSNFFSLLMSFLAGNYYCSN